jgi:hypothetical protein
MCERGRERDAVAQGASASTPGSVGGRGVMATQPRKGFVRVEPRKPEPRVEPEPEGAEPTDEQLCNIACVLGFPILATPIFQRMPHWRQSMLNLHALFQRAICGDTEAEAALNRLIEAFASAA